MPCTEFVDAINWNKKTTSTNYYPVVAYFTTHYGFSEVLPPGKADAVRYASGSVQVVDSPTPHLKGTLKAAKNTGNPGR